MAKLILLNKPFNVQCQFSPSENGASTLANYIPLAGVYPAGRLDKDSEGLVVLTDDGRLQHCISHPARKMNKIYWVQVEGSIDAPAIRQLCQGVKLRDGMTAPARARLIKEPAVWSRTPPIRYRANIPTSWIELEIREGRNRQVRRMTAAVGFPTLRLIRYAVGPWSLERFGDQTGNRLEPGEWIELTVNSEEICHDAGRSKTPHSRHSRRHHRTGRPLPHGRGNHQSEKGSQPARRPRGKR